MRTALPAAANPASIAELVEGAREMLAGATTLPADRAIRAAALFARCAVETFIDEELDRRLAPLGLTHFDAGRSSRGKLICLLAESGDDHDPRIEWLWDVLSTACHYHAYDLTPTHAEIAHLVDQVAELVLQ